MRLIARAFTLYQIFLAPPKVWRRPIRAEILIYDRVGADSFLPIVKPYSHEVLALRGESINLYCLIKSALTLRFWSGDSLNAYIDSFINLVSPKIVITYIDNDPRFYEISKRFPRVQTIFVQNGRRAELGFLEKNRNYHVDYMFVFGEAIGQLYSQFVSGTIHVIGSLRNNSILPGQTSLSNTVLYISSWEPEPTNQNPLFTLSDGREIGWKEYYSPEIEVLGFLEDWCATNNKLLQICGRSPQFQSKEEDFYRNLLESVDWEFLPRNSDTYSTYKRIDLSELVVFIESTCGYEALSRGKRTAALTCRGVGISVNSERFGWPMNLPDSGRFWTNSIDREKFKEILDFLNLSSDNDWEKVRQEYLPQIMAFDLNNTCLTKVLNEILKG